MQINILLSFSGNGGVEKMSINLMQGLLKLGYNIRLFRIKNRGEFVRHIPKEVETVQLPFKHTFLNIPNMAKLFQKEEIKKLMVMKERAGLMALISKEMVKSDAKIVIRFGTNITSSFKEKKISGIYLRARLNLLKRMLPKADGIICVSHGVAEDIVSFCPRVSKKIHVIKNPVITDKLYELSEKEIEDTWLIPPRKVPVVVGMGRLTHQKDFKTLIKAISIVKKEMDIRLIILGDGELKKELVRLTKELDIEDSVKFPGFKKNPYPYLKNADLFVLSSRWEGSPNSLTEALSLGTPVLSTDCPSGPREILKNGEVAPLVNVGDYKSMAKMIIRVLLNPPKKEYLTHATRDYHYLESARKYAEILSNL